MPDRSGARRTASFWLLALLFVLSVSGSLRGEAVRDAGAEPGVFSAERAAAHLEWICAEPHPMGSAAGARVAARLSLELQATDFETSVQQSASAAPPLNVIGHRPGRTDLPGWLFVAHHDSTPKGPGAGDDGVGVAALLEVARALSETEPLPRSVSILFTDGEENGMVGARAFLGESLPEWVDPSTWVINVEAVGNHGPTALFQAGPGNADLVAMYRAAAPRPHGSSLAEFIFSLLPNNTDFTAFRQAGFRGLNLAMVGGSAAYHAPFDTPENLHLPSLQRLGDTLLGIAQSNRDPEAPIAADVVYHSVAEVGLVTLPSEWARWAAGAFAIASLILLWVPHRSRPTIWTLVAALGVPAAAALFGDQTQAFISWTLEPLGALLSNQEARGDFASACLVSFGVLTLGTALTRLVRSRLHGDAWLMLCASGITLSCLGVLGLVLHHPGSAWVLALPLVPAACAIRLEGREAETPTWIIFLLCSVPVIWLAGVWFDLCLLTSLRPKVMGAIAWGTLAVGLPFVGALLGKRATPISWLDYAFGAIGLVLILGGTVARGAGY